MDQVLLKLNGLATLIQIGHAVTSQFFAASIYETPTFEANKQDLDNADDDTEEEELNLSLRKRLRSESVEEADAAAVLELRGSWTVLLGSDQGWWSVSFQGKALKNFIQSNINKATGSRLHLADAMAFSQRVWLAWQRQSIHLAIKRTESLNTALWPFIKVHIDLDTDPISLTLERLSSEAALAATTRLLLNSFHSLASEPQQTASRSLSSSIEHDQLQKKLEATQQALREERQKYRSLLAAPSASTKRTGRRPVVGLAPSFTNSSQRSLTLPPPSPSQGSKNKNEQPNSSSDIGPSSDDLQGDGVRQSQRASQKLRASLVNPTRVRRADPSDNDDFVGD
ncbi:uncharacterized protein MEPE_05812 [Melanopsichium pennsylvanicum]|uniref:Uncharacterized protein n=2 Tax=Melanopsichium pennsylvanicum TaxID=63383 RepID=A0AAJ4XSL8_9BASI|nr:putative protein [Melanopsichium pennsylvanicum 4]SNX87102.1 uncharacterized protein MEPE_05812 [Melanopsichium pennsylvanicum]